MIPPVNWPLYRLRFAGQLWEVFAPWKRAAATQGAVGA